MPRLHNAEILAMERFIEQGDYYDVWSFLYEFERLRKENDKLRQQSDMLKDIIEIKTDVLDLVIASKDKEIAGLKEYIMRKGHV